MITHFDNTNAKFYISGDVGADYEHFIRNKFHFFIVTHICKSLGMESQIQREV